MQRNIVEYVARAICSAYGSDPDAPFVDRHGRPSEGVKEWERWQGEARAAIKAVRAHTTAGFQLD